MYYHESVAFDNWHFFSIYKTKNKAKLKVKEQLQEITICWTGNTWGYWHNDVISLRAFVLQASCLLQNQDTSILPQAST